MRTTWVPVRVRTAASFQAEDPWNRSGPVAFTVEAYKMRVQDGLGTGSLLVRADVERFGIRSDPDGREHMLPESLSELWLTKKIPTEALPRLLKQMEPTLKVSDFRPVLHGGAKNMLVRISLLVPFVFFVIVPLVAPPDDLFFIIKVSLSMFLGLEAFVVLLHLPHILAKWRRRRQMKWALTHLSN